MPPIQRCCRRRGATSVRYNLLRGGQGKTIFELQTSVTQQRSSPVALLWVLLAAHANGTAWRTAQLIEYYGLGDVVRYEHLVDTFNNTYRALRVIDDTGGCRRSAATSLRVSTLYFSHTPIFRPEPKSLIPTPPGREPSAGRVY